MKKIITTLFLSFFFFVPHSLSVIAPTNLQQAAQNTVILKSSTGQNYKPNWLKRTQQKLLAKTINKQDSDGVKVLKWTLGFLCLLVGLTLFAFAFGDEEFDLRSFLVGTILTVLGLAFFWNLIKQSVQTNDEQAQIHKQYMNGFLNKEKSVVIETFGSFYTSVSDGKGGEILRYDSKEKRSGKTTYDASTKTITTTATSTIIYYTEFYINANGIIYNWREGQRLE